MPSTSLPSTITALQPNLTKQQGQNCSHYTTVHHTLLALIFVTAMLGNGFICVAFVLRRKLRTVTNYFVVNLAVADCLLVVLGFIWGILYISCAESNKLGFLTFQTLELIFSSGSVIGLAVVSYDRFYAVNHALHYGSTMTHTRAVIAIVAVWVYSTVTSFIRWGALNPSTQSEYLKVYTVILFVFNFFIPCNISMYCYVRIFLIAMMHLRHGAPANQLSDPLSKASTVRKQLKISLNIFVLAVPFLFMWNTYYGITVYEAFCQGCAVVEQFSAADDFLSNLPLIVAAINPAIFIFLTKDLRVTANMCLHCSQHSRRRGDFSQSESFITSTKYTTSYQGGRADQSISKV
ncbi:histamine H2 receptor [Exaiptasia diaphana]|uniref:G-protein coupled receptors family 1 profile domain-containing protein n=1 Tax=Exaiptasia diaphana TaxID=2652724 RepID=A0A913XKK8_EXADI|nr:histamine H2 receptor [Exaiptasia diaphana]